ncbi:MAG: ABC transporter permease [Defluviitaleaceae bacterium]|nr:ABC transporter permease [Defluviitaleaceae bacterium]
MHSVKAIFKKQMKDTLKNMGVLIQFIIYPLVAFAMTVLMDTAAIPYEVLAVMPNMVNVMAAVFAGMALVSSAAAIIAEDKEKKSLRFLVMANVKPPAYLLGVGGTVFFVSIFTSVAFSFISGFGGVDFWIFLASMMSGVTASILLGATIGLLTKNQQSATAIAMPIAMVLGFGPMMAGFNDTIARVLHITYTQQLNVVSDYLTIGGVGAPLWHSFAIMWANVVVFGIVFVIVYAKKGMK